MTGHTQDIVSCLEVERSAENPKNKGQWSYRQQYLALTVAAKEATHLKQFIADNGLNQTTITIYNDNKNFNSRTKTFREPYSKVKIKIHIEH